MSVLMGSVVCLSVAPESDHRPLTRRMSAPGLTSEAQMRYLLQWFGEFSEIQREDFLPILGVARSGRSEQLAATLAGLSCEDKPVSLFQCRIKLFNEWFPSWAEEDQDTLIKGVSEVDPEFGVKLEDLIKNGPQINGDENGTGEAHSPIEEQPLTNGDCENEELPEEPTEPQNISQENVAVEIAAAS